MFDRAIAVTKQTVASFIADQALTFGAAIAYYAIFSIGPILVIAIAMAGFVFGEDAAKGAIMHQLAGIMGPAGAQAVQSMIENAGHHQKGGLWATCIGLVTLLVTATGTLSEMQSALNFIFRASSDDSAVGEIVKARLLGLGIVVTLGFLLMVSLLVNTALDSLHLELNAFFPNFHLVLQVINIVVGFVLITVLFAAIYKVLPSRPIDWRRSLTGGALTAILFIVGRELIGLYISTSGIASSYGSAGAVIVVLLWVYYSAQIFLLGAEFTKAIGGHHQQPAPPGPAQAPKRS
jgi:membrane protein